MEAACDDGPIVVVADHGPWLREVSTHLAGAGYDVVADPSGDVAASEVDRAAAVIIDLDFRARSALALCAALRSRSAVPVVAVDHRGDDHAVMAAFAAGADHVASRGVTAAVLLARLRAVLRRLPAHPKPMRGCIDLDEYGVELTAVEIDMLRLLVARAGHVVTRAELVRMLPVTDRSERTLDFRIRRLREKLEAVDPERRIVVVRGIGFRYEAAPVDAQRQEASA